MIFGGGRHCPPNSILTFPKVSRMSHDPSPTNNLPGDSAMLKIVGCCSARFHGSCLIVRTNSSGMRLMRPPEGKPKENGRKTEGKRKENGRKTEEPEGSVKELNSWRLWTTAVFAFPLLAREYAKRGGGEE